MQTFSPISLLLFTICATLSLAAVENVCTSDAITAPDGRKVRFTGGGGSARRGTEQDASLDIPANIGEATELANIYLRDVNLKAYQVEGMELHGARFPVVEDATAWERFIPPTTIPTGSYTIWANLRLKNGGTCTIGSTQKLNLLL